MGDEREERRQRKAGWGEWKSAVLNRFDPLNPPGRKWEWERKSTATGCFDPLPSTASPGGGWKSAVSDCFDPHPLQTESATAAASPKSLAARG